MDRLNSLFRAGGMGGNSAPPGAVSLRRCNNPDPRTCKRLQGSQQRATRPCANQPQMQDSNLVDNSETVYISSLALLKMLRHGRAGVPMEVMGLMLGDFVDDYTVRVVDVFAMPQSGTGVSVEAVDPVFQTKMMDMLRQTGRYTDLDDPCLGYQKLT